MARDIVQWDVRTWARALPLWQRRIDRTRPRNALAIGERGGGLSLWLALQGIAVTCSDRRPFPAQTRDLHTRRGVADRITYESQDATAITHGNSSFDLVIFKSVLGALSTEEKQRTAIAEMHRVLRPGGTLLFAENLAGTGLHRLLRRRFIPWEHYWRYLELPRDLDMFCAFGRMEWKATGLLANLGRSEPQRDWLARFDAAVSAVTPPSWHYVLYGACAKGV